MEQEVENVDAQVDDWIKETKRAEIEVSRSNDKDEDNNDAADVEQPRKRKRAGKKTSSIWEHFTMIDGKDRAACNYCNLDYAANTKLCGTSILWSHVEYKCRKCPFSDWVEQNKKQQMSMLQFTKKTADSEVASSGQLVKFSQKKIKEEISTYFILDELPFRHVDGKGFQRLIRYFFPNSLREVERFDILEWWRISGCKYTIVSQMAKDVLAVQVSTIASESAFSTGERILDLFRSSLSPRMVEALICSKNWLTCESDEPIVLRQYMDEIEALETSEKVAPEMELGELDIVTLDVL
ncbi:Ribonuclease H-like domain containing protein [Parasponia andersonii]|uniref:Ribonuclease H-like domain containing protein n=1 Tax=Parasponia andersonii TaxID=3476 RepID=A0A2P5CDN1_PARAD|nr:Ribonuclease H-like domain containing protein [Parasponia andersonii]